MKNILITGGTGYIGSHTCIPLLERNYKLTIVDSNINSSPRSIERLKNLLKNRSFENKISFIKGDIRNGLFLKKIFKKAFLDNNPIEGVIHFAGLKSVSESFANPLIYWENNVLGSIRLLEIMKEYDCKKIVFSSSASIYGNQSIQPILENSSIKPISPYAYTKASIEYLLNSIHSSFSESWSIANLRYFNPIGAHPSGLIGENPLNIPSNIFPLICRVAKGSLNELKIYGNDWPTPDGTCLRDYIHVMDLAEAHRAALDFLFRSKPQIINLNIGTGIGTSVLELVNKFIEVNKCSIPYRFSDRRLGDLPKVIANNEKAILTLDWKPKRNLNDMCKDGWRWQSLNPNGY